MESSLEAMNKAGSTAKAVNETSWRVPGKHRETLHNSSQQQRKKLCSVSIYIHIHTYTREGLWKSSSDLSREGMVNHSTPHSSSPQSQPILTCSRFHLPVQGCQQLSHLHPQDGSHGRGKQPGQEGACGPSRSSVHFCFCCWCEADFSCSWTWLNALLCCCFCNLSLPCSISSELLP